MVTSRSKFIRIQGLKIAGTSAMHRDLKSTSHKNFCNRILTIHGYILGHGVSKKSCLNSGRNRSAHKI